MSIHFWKYVDERYRYLNWRLCIPLWICLVLKFFTGFYDWLLLRSYLLAMAFDGIHHFFNCCILIGIVLGIYAMIKVTRHQKRQLREMREQHERQVRELREQRDRRHNEWLEEQLRQRHEQRGVQ